MEFFFTEFDLLTDLTPAFGLFYLGLSIEVFVINIIRVTADTMHEKYSKIVNFINDSATIAFR